MLLTFRTRQCPLPLTAHRNTKKYRALSDNNCSSKNNNSLSSSKCRDGQYLHLGSRSSPTNLCRKMNNQSSRLSGSLAPQALRHNSHLPIHYSSN